MKRTVLSLAVLGSLVASAAPYTEGWLTHVPKPADTNYLELSGDYHPKSISVITNRPKLKLAMAKSATAALKSTSAPASLDDFEKLLPTADQARLKELARGLEYDWVKCFDFVRNHIAFSLYPGIMRGAERTLIDREGNDADQSLLLVALLRLSGYEASVIYEPAQIDSWIRSGFALPIFNYNGESPYNVADWLGIKSSGSAQVIKDTVLSRLSKIGYNYATLNTTSVVIPHYWVALKIGDVTQYLDPSLKPSKATFAHDALTDMGYDRDALIAAAGGTTISGMGVRNLSASGIASHLTSLCTNLRNVWTNANESAEYFVGGKKIVKRTDDAYFHGKYFSDAPIDLSKQTAEYVNALRTKTVLTCNGSAFFEFYLDEVGLRNLWLTSSGSSTVLHLDDATLATVSTSSSYYNIELVVDVQHSSSTTHPYYLTRGEDRVYSLAIGFDGDAKNGVRKYAAEELSRLRATGLADSSPRMIAASLYVQGQQWVAQCAMSQRLLNNLTGDNHRRHYNIGIAGQSGGPYVDMANSFSHSGNNNALVGADMFVSSALEHSVVEQLNDVGAVSTIKILNLANQNGNAVYFVSSQNVDSVIANISNYGSSFKSTLQSETSEGAIYLLPGNGNTTLNQWSGVGYVKRKASDGSIQTTMAISGGYNGGFCSKDMCLESEKYLYTYQPNITPQNTNPDNYCADPVSLPFGAYHDQKEDLVLNRRNPLVWSREYDSRSALSNTGLGRGWSHNYESSASKSTDAEAIFGQSSPERVAAAVVAMMVADDMLVSGSSETALDERARRWMIAALATQWLTDQLNNTAVSIKTGAKCSNFLKLPDGTYSPDPGDTSALTEQLGLYTLKERHGNKYTFDWKNMLSVIEDRSGNKTTLTYTYDQLTNAYLVAVENDFDARIDITWDGSSISKVTDSAGRSVEYTYDSDGRLTTVKDVRGKNWTMTYDPSLHTLVSKSDPIGQRLIYNNYNQFGQVTNQISDVGGVWSFGYLGTVSAWNEDPHGNKMQQWYDDSSHALMTLNRDGTVTEDEYDGHGHLVVSYDELGHATRSAYDDRDNLISLVRGTGALEQTTTFSYDGDNHLVATTDALGSVTRLSYDSCDRLVETVAPDGSRVSNTWNSNGTLSEIRKHDVGNQCVSRVATTFGAYGMPTATTIFGVGLPNAGIASSVSYNSVGLPVSKTDANGNVTQIAYDAEGKVVSATDAIGATATRSYADNGQLSAQTDALGRTTTFVRSASGKVVSTHFADGTSTSNRYDLLDQLVESRDARGGYALVTYDPRGRVISTTGPSGTAYVVYDEAGQVTATTNAAGEVALSSYDELGRRVSAVDGLGSTWLTEYDKLNRATASANPLGKIKQQSYDIMSRLSVSTSSMGSKDRFGYDAFGNLASYTNAEGNVYRRFYDAAGHVLAVTNALGIGVSQLTYDDNGNLVRSVDGENHVITYGYDKVNRLISAIGDDFAITKQYDAVGNVVRATNEEADETFAYDKNNALVAASLTIGAKTYDLAWGRDAGGLVTNITYESGKSVVRTYDLNGRLICVRDWLGHSWDFQYDALGRLTRLTYPTGVEKVCTYDAVGRLASWRVGTIQGRTMTYDAAGRRTADRIDYGPMPVVATQKRSGVYNAADQLVSGTKIVSGVAQNEQYVHDRNGAMTSALESGETVRSFAYNSRGQFAGLTEGGKTETCTYDAMGNRIILGGSVLVPDFTDGLSRPLHEVSATLTRYYIWGNNELLGVIDSSGTFLATYSDSFSSIIACADVSGNLLSNVIYGPHGEIWNRTGASLNFGWLAGYGVRLQFRDLYVTQHRLYDVVRQRFLSSDPMGIEGGLNLYAYASGNAMAYIDPMGLCAEEVQNDWDGSDEVGGMLSVATSDGDSVRVSMAGLEYSADRLAEYAYVNGIIDKATYDNYKIARKMGAAIQECIAGAGMTLAGVAGTGTGVGAVVGVAVTIAGVSVFLHGLDNAVAAYGELKHGDNAAHTVTEGLMQESWGLDERQAEVANNYVSLAFTTMAGSVNYGTYTGSGIKANPSANNYNYTTRATGGPTQKLTKTPVNKQYNNRGSYNAKGRGYNPRNNIRRGGRY